MYVLLVSCLGWFPGDVAQFTFISYKHQITGKYSIKFSLFPAHLNISHNKNNENVHIMCRKRGGLKTVLMNVRPKTLTVVNYQHNYHWL